MSMTPITGFKMANFQSVKTDSPVSVPKAGRQFRVSGERGPREIVGSGIGVLLVARLYSKTP